MTREEIYLEVHRLLFEESGELSREDYRELLETIEGDCRVSIDALDADED